MKLLTACFTAAYYKLILGNHQHVLTSMFLINYNLIQKEILTCVNKIVRSSKRKLHVMHVIGCTCISITTNRCNQNCNHVFGTLHKRDYILCNWQLIIFVIAFSTLHRFQINITTSYNSNPHTRIKLSIPQATPYKLCRFDCTFFSHT